MERKRIECESRCYSKEDASYGQEDRHEWWKDVGLQTWPLTHYVTRAAWYLLVRMQYVSSKIESQSNHRNITDTRMTYRCFPKKSTSLNNPRVDCIFLIMGLALACHIDKYIAYCRWMDPETSKDEKPPNKWGGKYIFFLFSLDRAMTIGHVRIAIAFYSTRHLYPHFLCIK